MVSKILTILFLSCSMLLATDIRPTAWQIDYNGPGIRYSGGYLRRPGKETVSRNQDTMKTLLSFAAVALVAAHVQAQSSVTFQWDPIPPQGTNAITYILRWGSASRTYSQQMTTPGTSLTVTNLSISTNFVAVFASVKGVDSDPSNEIGFVQKPPAPGNLRIPVQGASTVTGQWTNIAELTIPLDWNTNAPFFVRIAPTLERH